MILTEESFTLFTFLLKLIFQMQMHLVVFSSSCIITVSYLLLDMRDIMLQTVFTLQREKTEAHYMYEQNE